tara:strand:- start:176 stop:412 length:237 start_codon:yes stop_codon:yes gene_type:complete
MNQVDNLQAGDLVVFIENGNCVVDAMACVVDDCPDPHDEQAVLIQFYGGDNFIEGPIHYYHRELDAFLEKGEIRIQHG